MRRQVQPRVGRPTIGAMNFGLLRRTSRIALPCAATSAFVALVAASLAIAGPLGPLSKFDGKTAHGRYAHVDVTDCSKVRCDRDVPKTLKADLIVKTAREDVTCEGG